MKTIWIALFFMLLSSNAFAIYSDQVGAPIEEVWQAAKDSMKPYGIQKEDLLKKHFETRWVEDRVVRSSGLLKKVASRIYRLRYRMRLEFVEDAKGTKVDVKGTYRQKPLDGSLSSRWETTRPERDLEREFFYKVLRQVETNRRAHIAKPEPL